MSECIYIDCGISGEDFICDRQSITCGNVVKLRFRFSSDWASLSKYANFRISKSGTDETGQLTITSDTYDITGFFEGADFFEFGFIGKDESGNVVKATNIRCILLKDGAYIVNPGATAENLSLAGRFSVIEAKFKEIENIEDGKDGADGVGIKSVEQTTASDEDGGVNVITVTLTDGTVSVFKVKNGSAGNADASGLLAYKEIYGEELDDMSVISSIADEKFCDISLYYNDGYSNCPISGAALIFTATDDFITFNQLLIALEGDYAGLLYARVLDGTVDPAEVYLWKSASAEQRVYNSCYNDFGLIASEASLYECIKAMKDGTIFTSPVNEVSNPAEYAGLTDALVMIIKPISGNAAGYLLDRSTAKLYTAVFSPDGAVIKDWAETSGGVSEERHKALIGAYSIERERVISLSGDELTEKTSDYIHVSSITNGNAVIFGEEFETTGRYFGYVGIKQAIEAGEHYMLFAEIDIETDFDLSKARVQGFYRTASTGDLPTGVIIGTPKSGKNYVLYPFTADAANTIHGFYIDAQSGNAPTVKLTLHDIRLFKRTIIARSGYSGLKDWKCDILKKGETVLSVIGDYCIYDNEVNALEAYSLSSEMTANIVLYKPLDEVFASKDEVKKIEEENEALTAALNQKGVFMNQYAAGEKCPLEIGCLYLIRCNTETAYYYKNGEKLSQYTEGFGDGIVLMAGNIFQGAHVNFFTAPAQSGIMSFSMNGYTITTLDADDVYVMSESDYINVWKLKH